MLLFLRYLKKAFVNPERTGYQYSLIRTFLLKPVIFDITSLIIQLVSMSRQDKALKNNSEEDGHFNRVFDYNAMVTDKHKISTTRRPEEYFRVLGPCAKNRENQKILLIGPRNVFELYLCWLYGFKWDNIFSIDLYSNHPKIQVMNMEEMTFPDETFDYVLLSRVYAYAKDPKGFIAGISRILKTGGKVVFEANYIDFKNSKEWSTDTIRGSETMGYLAESGLNISYYRYYEKIDNSGNEQASHSIGATKIDKSKKNKDLVFFIPELNSKSDHDEQHIVTSENSI
ncbi:MAG: hypothetical protein CME70_21455 [Halobacteriovorax sp.]|nr:hypothetical protein [Halobacteriovorax sp.]|tara:strand:- start:150234 stop:151088 length:855 start_codon:yes stop_codon:yes gene_type:complete